MKFDQIPYQRPDIAALTSAFNSALEQFNKSQTAAAALQSFEQINHLRTRFASAQSLCHIRHTINTADAFYDEENQFFDEQSPNMEALNNTFYRALLNTAHRSAIEARWGKQLFNIATLSLKTFDPVILPDLQEENKLGSEYTKTLASAKIEVDGKVYNLSSIRALETSSDRATRKRALQAKWAFLEAQSEKIEQIYHQQVAVRHRMAQKLGFPNFVPLGYARMLRSDYDAAAVATFRAEVLEYIVPIATQLFERQRKRLGLERLHYYDLDFRYPSGNPKPKGEPDWIIRQAEQMYSELSPETKEFFSFMQQNQLMDLVSKPGKAPGGYCTYIGEYKAPFIFSNFNGTSGDIDVLTHEAGHAFQVYSSRELGISEYNWPTYEACEIHSMSMEFFTWPWMQLFFGADVDKYKFAHLSEALLFMPYGVAIDEFQHFVYENPDITPAERKEGWRAIERKYLPHRRYDDIPFLEKGGFWIKQSHLFGMPFYYIDYVLAQVCALQFWHRSLQDRTNAWNDYLNLCQAGGSRSFLDLVQLAGLKNPFEPGCLQEVAQTARQWLEAINDQTY